MPFFSQILDRTASPDGGKKFLLPRVPLLKILVALMSGIALERAHHCEGDCLIVLVVFGALVAGVSLYFSGKSFRYASRLCGICACTSAMLIGYSWVCFRAPSPLVQWGERPAREAVLSVKVDRVFKGDKWGRVSGLASVVEAPGLIGEISDERILFRTKEAPPSFQEGAVFKMRGILERRSVDVASGEGFDRWLDSQGVYFKFFRARPYDEGLVKEAPEWKRNIEEVRLKLAQLLKGGKEHEIEPNGRYGAMLAAMFLGEKDMLTPLQKDRFRMSGMMHLFAVSGLHVGLVALVIEALLSLLRIGKRARGGVSLLVLAMYVLLIGAGASAVRAFIMLFFHRAGRVIGRPSSGLAALVASALAVLFWDPEQLFDTGAILSYGIVGGILIYGVPLGQVLIERLPLYEHVPSESLGLFQQRMIWARNYLCEAVGVSLGAFLVGAPLSVQFFGVFAPGSILLNLLLVPVAFVAVSAASLASLCYAVALVGAPFAFIFEPIGAFIARVGWAACFELDVVIEWFGAFAPVSWSCSFSWPVMGNVLAIVILLYGLLLVRNRDMRQRLRYWLLPWGILGVTLIF